MNDIGQNFIVGFNGTSYNDELEELIVKYKIGGIILFKRNISDSRFELKNMLTQIQEKAKSINIPPLFVAIDHEGGRVHRLGDLATHFPAPYSMELLGEDDLYRVYVQQGGELVFFGFNMVFGPVLDLCSSDSKGAIGDRSFGTDFKSAMPRILIAQKGLEKSGILTVLKHFPGHGSVGVDPHYNLPHIEKDLSEFEEYDLLPFKEAVKKGTNAIMSAHILASSVDAVFPATISKTWLTYLRDKLLFKGMIVSDDLCMKALWDNYSIEEITEIGVRAGLDSLCICFNDGEFDKAFQRSYNFLTRLVAENDSVAKYMKKAQERIKDLKKKFSGLKAFNDELIFIKGKDLLKEIAEKCLD